MIAHRALTATVSTVTTLSVSVWGTSSVSEYDPGGSDWPLNWT